MVNIFSKRIEKTVEIMYNVLGIKNNGSDSRKTKRKKSRVLYPFFCSLFWRYFCFVASPPRKCLSDLLNRKTSATCACSDGFVSLSLYVRSLCTVLLLIPKCFAAARTVQLLSKTYSAILSHLSLRENLIMIAPRLVTVIIYALAL